MRALTDAGMHTTVPRLQTACRIRRSRAVAKRRIFAAWLLRGLASQNTLLRQIANLSGVPLTR